MSSSSSNDDKAGKHSEQKSTPALSTQERTKSQANMSTSQPPTLPASNSVVSTVAKNHKIWAITPPRNVRRFAKRYRTEICSASSSVLSTVITFPLDFVKSRMQSFGTTFKATVNEAYKAEGVRGFWKGVGPPVISIAFVRMTSFSIYQNSKYYIDRNMQEMFGKSPLAMANAPNSYPNIWTASSFAVAGACSGLIITSISCPFELTKLNEQLHGKLARDSQLAREAAVRNGTRFTEPHIGSKSPGALATARKLVKERGIAGLYSGYRLHLLRDSLGTAIYFSTYESVKQILANGRGKDPTAPTAVFIAGGLCGIVSWACIYPLDVAKTVYQKALLSNEAHKAKCPPIKFFSSQSYRGKFIQSSGLGKANLTTGLGVSAWRSAFINMIFFSSFEKMKKQINALDDD